jgi:hypothetical protein
VYFNALSNKRSQGFVGDNPIPYTDILAYFTLHQITPKEYELWLLDRFDILYLNHQRAKQK